MFLWYMTDEPVRVPHRSFYGGLWSDHFLVTIFSKSLLVDINSRIVAKPEHNCESSYVRVAGFALKMPLKLLRYCRKTRIHNRQATSAGAMLSGAIVR